MLEEQLGKRRLRLTDEQRRRLDSKFSDRFRRILRDAGVKLVQTCCQAPNMTAFAAR